jgi:hypothetical protein
MKYFSYLIHMNDINNNNLNQFMIYKNNNNFDFYNDFYINELKKLYDENKNNIQTYNIPQNQQEIHKRRMIEQYLIPLGYLIYSYIYQNYYKIQQIREKENEYTTDIYFIYKYFFDFKNPIIKKVNVFFHQMYHKTNHKTNSNKLISGGGNEENNSKIEFDEEIREGKIIDHIIDFLNDYQTEMKKEIEEENNKSEIIEDIHKNLEKIKQEIENIKDIFYKIISKKDSSNNFFFVTLKNIIQSSKYKSINNIDISKTNNEIKNSLNDININLLVEYLSFKEINDISIFTFYSIDYNDIINYYKNILGLCKKVNLSILQLNDKDNKIISDEITYNEITY